MKIYNCEECGFSTKYKNRINYHINVRRKCGIENINFKRECDDNAQENPELNKYSEIINTINTRQSELDEQEQTLKSNFKQKKVPDLEQQAKEWEEETTLPPPPVCKRYMRNDPTIEKIGELLSQNPNGLP